MATYYHDSSALIKHYHTELGTPVVGKILSEPNALHYLSRLSGVEVPSAFAKKVRTQEITIADFQRMYQKFLADMTQPQYRIIRLLERHLQRAEQLVQKYGLTGGLRTLDAIQLAVAMDADNRHGIDYFVCADTNLCNVATAEGYSVINPTTATP